MIDGTALRCFELLIFIIYHLLNYKNQIVNYKETPKALFGVLFRGCNHIIMMVCCIMSFIYADAAHINQGVIAGLYVTSIVFTTIVFKIVYA